MWEGPSTAGGGICHFPFFDFFLVSKHGKNIASVPMDKCMCLLHAGASERLAGFSRAKIQFLASRVAHMFWL